MLKLNKSQIAELDREHFDKVSGGTVTYASCAGTCGCPATVTTSDECPKQRVAVKILA